VNQPTETTSPGRTTFGRKIRTIAIGALAIGALSAPALSATLAAHEAFRAPIARPDSHRLALSVVSHSVRLT
jgi:hypothetical protein